MRNIIDLQMNILEIPISEIKIDPRSRDEVPKLLKGLQSIYCNKIIRKKVFKILEEMIPNNVDPKNGRKGMDLWKIFVLGAVRLNSNWDYDRLHDSSNNHEQIRQMMMDTEQKYSLQTIKDNIKLLTPIILNNINKITIDYGHEITDNKKCSLKGSCDSFVVETDVHYPTDINLLFDAIRKIINHIMHLCNQANVSNWRQGKSNLRKAKMLFRNVQQLKRSTSNNPRKKAEREQEIINAHKIYIKLVRSYII